MSIIQFHKDKANGEELLRSASSRKNKHIKLGVCHMQIN